MNNVMSEHARGTDRWAGICPASHSCERVCAQWRYRMQQQQQAAGYNQQSRLGCSPPCCPRLSNTTNDCHNTLHSLGYTYRYVACGLHIAYRRGPSAVVYILVLWPLLTLEDRPSSMPYTAQPASDCKTFRTLCEPHRLTSDLSTLLISGWLCRLSLVVGTRRHYLSRS